MYVCQVGIDTTIILLCVCNVVLVSEGSRWRYNVIVIAAHVRQLIFVTLLSMIILYYRIDKWFSVWQCAEE